MSQGRRTTAKEVAGRASPQALLAGKPAPEWLNVAVMVMVPKGAAAAEEMDDDESSGAAIRVPDATRPMSC